MELFDNRFSPLLRKIVMRLVAQDFDAINDYSHGVRLTSDHIRQAILDYGRKLIMPPDSAFADLDVIQVTHAPQFDMVSRFDLWTEDEGRSDLMLECTFIDRGGESLDVEIDNLHVL